MFTTAGDSSRKYHCKHGRGRDFINTFPHDKQEAVMNLERAKVDERCDCNKKRKWVCRRRIVVVVVAAVWMNGRRE
ncbi:hypothetical protein TNCV_1402391 [Trichonephila clavipes]|nr:hypothetical protein TNCV_1402391 [Trichonephila clavipes]